MSLLAAIHPVLNRFYSDFTSEHPGASGKRTGDSNDFTVGNFQMVGSYFVSGTTINFTVEKKVQCIGPGGGLLAGRIVVLDGPEIELVGSLEEPIEVVAVDKLTIHAETLKIRNVSLYLFDNAGFSIQAACYSVFENVSLFRVDMVDEVVTKTLVCHWQQKDDFTDFIARRTLVENLTV